MKLEVKSINLSTDVPRKAWNVVLERMECDALWCKWNFSLDLKPSEIDLIYLESEAYPVFRTGHLAADLQPSKGLTSSLSYLSDFFTLVFSVKIPCNLKAGKT